MPVGMAVFIGVSVMFVRVRRDVDAKAFVIDQGVDEFVQIVEHGQGRGGVDADKGIDEDQADAPFTGAQGGPIGQAGFVFAIQVGGRVAQGQQGAFGRGFGQEPVPALVAAIGEVGRRQAVAAQAIGCIAHVHLVPQHRVIGKGNDLGAQRRCLAQGTLDSGRGGPGRAHGAGDQLQARLPRPSEYLGVEP